MSESRRRRLFISYCFTKPTTALGFGNCEVEVDYPFENNVSISNVLDRYFKASGTLPPQSSCVLFWKFYDE
jgi:hypothetical protein